MEPGHILFLPEPSKLDSSSVVTDPIVCAVAREFLTIAPLAPSEKANHEALLVQLKAQLRLLENRLAPFFARLEPETAMAALNEKQIRYAAHFHAVYADGNPADLLVAATIASFCKFYCDQLQGTSLLPLEVAHLFAAAQRIVDLFAITGDDPHETAKKSNSDQPPA